MTRSTNGELEKLRQRFSRCANLDVAPLIYLPHVFLFVYARINTDQVVPESSVVGRFLGRDNVTASHMKRNVIKRGV